MTNITSVGSERFDSDFLEKLRSDGDPDADAAIATFFDDELDAPAEGLMNAMIRHHPNADEASPALSAFLNEPVELPEWYDDELFVAGQQLFAAYLPQFGLALWMASIPAGYAGARDVKVLWGTRQLREHPKRRFLETGQFVLDVMTPGSLEPGSKGLNDIRHVRLMHAAVRHMLTHEADDIEIKKWDDSTGVPINQEALLATMFTFNVVGIQSVNKFGIHLNDEEREAYIHAWSVIGYLMGVRGDLLPLNYADSAAIWQAIKDKEYDESPEGVALTAAAINVMRDLIPGRFVDGLPAAGLQFLLGRQTAKLLGVGRPSWTYALFLPMHAFGDLSHRFQHDFAPGRWASERLGRQVMKSFIEGEWNDERRPRTVKRNGKIAFEVEPEIRRAIGLDE